jgi:transposase-like protein
MSETKSGPKRGRVFSTDFKVALVVRLDRGEALASVAREAGIRRKLLYEWRASFRAEGVAGLNRKRGPKPGARRKPAAPAGNVGPAPAGTADARARIVELERKIGQQEIDLDFFARALRAWDGTAEQSCANPASTRSSKP